MANQRPGLQPVTQLEQKLRAVLEPMTDIVGRLTGATIPALRATSQFTPSYLTASATLVDVINRVNLLHQALNTAIADLNAVKARLQED